MDDVARGYFNLLRWRTSPTRDEARNVAILLVSDAGEGCVRAAPLSRISPRLHDQGILDDVLLGLEERLTSGADADTLAELSRTLEHSLVVTEPKIVALEDLETTLTALYRAYVAPRGGGGRGRTKGVVLDRVVAALRRRHLSARRGYYVGDFIFNVVVEPEREPTVLEVLSFAAERKTWTPIEHETGHFLYGVRALREEDISLKAAAIIEPPVIGNGAAETYDRVRRWLENEQVPALSPEELADPQHALKLGAPASG